MNWTIKCILCIAVKTKKGKKEEKREEYEEDDGLKTKETWQPSYKESKRKEK